MNTTERHFHHFGQVLHRRKRLLSKCIKIRVTRWSSLWSLLFHPSLGTIICLNQDNELCKKTEGKTPVTYPLAGKTKHPKRNFTVVHVNFFLFIFYTISANLAVTVGVTGTEESLGLGVVQDACTWLEVLEEQPADRGEQWVHRPKFSLAKTCNLTAESTVWIQVN